MDQLNLLPVLKLNLLCQLARHIEFVVNIVILSQVMNSEHRRLTMKQIKYFKLFVLNMLSFIISTTVKDIQGQS
ncbi:hypothetical protein EBT31_21555 [bacterium]|nr:hypothetical protein [bacterium]